MFKCRISNGGWLALSDEIVCVGRIDPHNNGDRASLPSGYWEWLRQYPIYDLGNTYPHMIRDKIVIVGGAGLLHPPFKRSLDVIARDAKEIYLWGVGLNTHDVESDYSPLEWPIVQKAKLIGVRDHIDLAPEKYNDWMPFGCSSLLRVAAGPSTQGSLLLTQGLHDSQPRTTRSTYE